MAHNELGRGWNEPKKPPKPDREEREQARAEQRFFAHLGEHHQDEVGDSLESD